MNLLDENVRDDQRDLLRQWRIPFRQVGREISRFGIQDEDLIPVLCRLKNPTLFTQDKDFFNPRLAHARYSLIFLEVSNIEVAEYISRVLRHPNFCTKAQRMGKVLRVHGSGIRYWQTGERGQLFSPWF